MSQNLSIGVFDSGVGGTTILKEILLLLPQENIIYYGDSGNAPYGEKSVEEIQNFCSKILDFFMKNGCKAVVIACNTATAAALDKLTVEYSIPIIGVITPGAKGAMKVTKNKKINILATPFTVSSHCYIKELDKFSSSLSIFQEGCPELCPMIENGWDSYPDREEILKNHISKLSKSADTLILGCTHYPIIENDIKKYFSGTIVDPAKETAIDLKNLLKKKKLLNSSGKKGSLDFFISGNIDSFKNIVEKFLGFSIKNIYPVEK